MDGNAAGRPGEAARESADAKAGEQHLRTNGKNNQALDGRVPRVVATHWRAHRAGSLEGFCDLDIADLRICGCSVHSKDGSRWINMPSKPLYDRATGQVLRDAKTGKIKYQAVIEVRPSARRALQAAALTAIDALLATTGGA